MPFRVAERSAVHWVLRVLGAALIVWLVLYPPRNFGIFRLNQVTDALVFSLAALSLNLLIGYTGQISLGHSAFFGIGAYATGILVVNHGWSPGWTFVAGALIAFVAGVIIGIPALRLKGLYLALVTLAIAVMFPSLVRRFGTLTEGSQGIKGLRYRPPSWTNLKGREGDAEFKYWLMIALLVIGYVIVRNLVKSRVGRAMVAVRDNDVAAQAMGINVGIIRTVVFGISAGLCALAGSMQAVRLGVVTPDNPSLTLLGSILFLVAMVIGGTATLAGPIVGGLAYYFIDYLTRDWAKGPLASVIFGALLIALMFVAPQGIVGLVKRLARAVVRIVPRQPESRRKVPLPSASVAEDVVVDSPTAGATVPDPRPFTSNQPLKGEA
jgi:branched-chain amino acid transport system permease protein